MELEALNGKYDEYISTKIIEISTFYNIKLNPINQQTIQKSILMNDYDNEYTTNMNDDQMSGDLKMDEYSTDDDII